jgi:hypothetical protein
MRTLDPRALNRALLGRQFLLDRQPLPAAEVLASLVGLQGQAPLAPYVGLWSRVAGFAPGELADQVASGAAVRLPLFRATVHLVTAEDGRALRPLVQPVLERSFGGSPWAKRLVGVDLDAVRAVGEELLATPLTRTMLGERLAERFPADPLALAYAVTYLVPAVQAPPRGVWGGTGAASWQAFGTAGPAAPADLARRYLRAFGPATPADLATWSGLTGTRALLDELRPELRTFRDERGRELLDVEDGLLPPRETPAPPRFLPEYDNVLLAHAERTRVVEAGLKPPAPPGNGARRGTVLVDGFMRAEWVLGETALRIDARRPLTSGHRAELLAEAEQLLVFLGAAGRDVLLA